MELMKQFRKSRRKTNLHLFYLYFYSFERFPSLYSRSLLKYDGKCYVIGNFDMSIYYPERFVQEIGFSRIEYHFDEFDFVSSLGNFFYVLHATK